MATKKSTRATRSKQETAVAFEDVQRDVASREPLPESEISVRKTQEGKLRDVLENLSLETAVQVLTAAGVGMTRTVTELSTRLQDTARQVEELQEVKALLVKDIEELHGKEIAASAIEDLVASHKEQSESLNRALSQLQDNINYSRQQLQAEWVREQQEHQRLVNETNAQITEARRRDEETYQYTKKQERARAELAFQNEQADKKRANDLKQADLERGWAAREAELKSKEQEFVVLKARVDGIQAEIDAAVKKEVAIVSNSINRDHKHAAEIAARDAAGAQNLLTAQVENLKAQLASANNVIAQLQQQLTGANEKVAKIASDALTAASGTTALAEMRNVLASGGSNASQKKV